MKLLKTALKRFNSADRRIRIAVLAAAFLIAMFIAARVAFWTMAFVFIGSVAEVYNSRFRTPFHFDLVKIGTVLTSVAYGAPVGIFVGITSTFFSKLLSSRLDFTVFISIAGTVAIAALANAFSAVPISLLGILLVLAYYLVTTPVHLIMGEEPGYALVYVLSSLAVNFVLFTQVAPRIIGLL